LQATPDDPETWSFADWNDENPKRIESLNFSGLTLSGAASFVGLSELIYLGVGNQNLTAIDVSGLTNLITLWCNNNQLTTLNVSGLTNLTTLHCNENRLTALDLTGLNLSEFIGYGQSVSLTLTESETTQGEYTLDIDLNEPEFDNSAITYTAGVLKSTDKTVINTYFEVQTVNSSHKLSGWMVFSYVDYSEYSPADVAVINALIANNGLQATPDDPETWDFATWNDATTMKRITILDFYDYTGQKLSGAASFAGLSELMYLDVGFQNLTAIDVSGLTNLEILYCDENQLTALDLSGLNLNDFIGFGQYVSLTLTESETAQGEYTLEIDLNEPEFSENAITYSGGVLKSTDKTVAGADFEVQTGNSSHKLSGTMEFTYVDFGDIEYLVTVSGGTTNGSSTGMYKSGATVAIVATVPQNHTFVNWTVQPPHNASLLTDANSASTTFVMPAGVVTVTANFAPQQPTTNAPELTPENPLRAWMRNGLLHITGLTVGETVSIYNAVGALVYNSNAPAAEMDIPLNVQGVYIVRSGGNVVRVVINN